jgi:hypothetical protein
MPAALKMLLNPFRMASYKFAGILEEGSLCQK